jgi:hypothetical protein
VVVPVAVTELGALIVTVGGGSDTLNVAGLCGKVALCDGP